MDIWYNKIIYDFTDVFNTKTSAFVAFKTLRIFIETAQKLSYSLQYIE